MVAGAKKSRSMKRVAVRKPSGVSEIEYRRARPGKAMCPTGRTLPGTVRGTKHEVSHYTKTQRRPSRPYGGVLSSPALRQLMRVRANELFVEPEKAVANVFAPGTVCMKIAGRDAGQLCVVTERIDKQFVKIDGFTRPRKCSMKHLEPTGKVIDVKKSADSKTLQAALKA